MAAQAIEGLAFSEEKTKYIIEHLDPILEEMVQELVALSPADPTQFMIDWLRKRRGVVPQSGQERAGLVSRNLSLKRELQGMRCLSLGFRLRRCPSSTGRRGRSTSGLQEASGPLVAPLLTAPSSRSRACPQTGHPEKPRRLRTPRISSAAWRNAGCIAPFLAQILTRVFAICLARRDEVDSRRPKAHGPLRGASLWTELASATEGSVKRGAPKRPLPLDARLLPTLSVPCLGVSCAGQTQGMHEFVEGAVTAAGEGDKGGEEESEEEDYDDDMPDDFIPPAVVSRGPRASVSAEAYGQWNKVKAFTPPQHPKDDAATSRIRDILRNSFMFSSLEPKDMDTVVLAMVERVFEASGVFGAV